MAMAPRGAALALLLGAALLSSRRSAVGVPQCTVQLSPPSATVPLEGSIRVNVLQKCRCCQEAPCDVDCTTDYQPLPADAVTLQFLPPAEVLDFSLPPPQLRADTPPGASEPASDKPHAAAGDVQKVVGTANGNGFAKLALPQTPNTRADDVVMRVRAIATDYSGRNVISRDAELTFSGSAPPPPVAPAPAKLLLAPTKAVRRCGEPVKFTARALNATGGPVAGTNVTFGISGDCLPNLSAKVVTTDANGYATITLLSDRPGTVAAIAAAIGADGAPVLSPAAKAVFVKGEHHRHGDGDDEGRHRRYADAASKQALAEIQALKN